MGYLPFSGSPEHHQDKKEKTSPLCGTVSLSSLSFPNEVFSPRVIEFSEFRERDADIPSERRKSRETKAYQPMEALELRAHLTQALQTS